MGCYDTVQILCPNCQEVIEVQSKGGGCNLNVYPGYSVPFSVAEYIDGDEVTCEKCEVEFTLEVAPENTSIILRRDIEGD